MRDAVASALSPQLAAGAAIRRLSAAFRSSGLDGWESDARILVLAAIGVDRAALARDPDRPIGPACEQIRTWSERRLAREPVSRILGRREFWGMSFAITSAVLDPRPETETLIEAALEELRPRRAQALTALDLGTGSGALLCALLSELPLARGLGLDRSAAACSLARDNLARHGLSGRAAIRQGDWADFADAGFDAVLCNPPYIPTAEIGSLDPEVRLHDPSLALDGGDDGLAAFRAVAPVALRALAPGGVAVFELGHGQRASVAGVLEAAGLSITGLRTDLAGCERALVCRALDWDKNESPSKISVRGLGEGGERD